MEPRVRVRLVPGAPALVLDWSFVVFWRFFATKAWFLRARAPEEGAALMATPDFVDTFARTFADAVAKLRKKYGVPRGNVIALMDAPRASLWRTLEYPEYKGTRVTSIEGAAFDVALGLRADMGVQSVDVPGLEADDLAFLVKGRLLDLGVSDVVMFTNDNDWGQLAEPRVRVVNRDETDVGVRCGSLVRKCLCGDPGDNIPPAFARCGKATADRLAGDPAAMEAHFAKNQEARAGYERNRRLIDLSCLPDACRASFDADVAIELE